MDPVYLDHAATTPLAPTVLDAMLPFLGEHFGNASSVHARGRRARHAVESARNVMAEAMGMDPAGIWFTSGGTEANNTAIRGLAARRDGAVVTGATEHESVIRSVERLARAGRRVVLLAPGEDGSVEPDAVTNALSQPVALVSVMVANNETGALTRMTDIATACRNRGVPLHTDAVQMAAFQAVAPDTLGADLVTISAHKLGGPTGIGALLVGSDADCGPLIVGGGQERGRRAGTENVSAIVGFAEAVRLSVESMASERRRLSTLRRRLERGLTEALGTSIRITTGAEQSAPHILHCTFPEQEGRRTDGEMLILRLDMEGIQASAGSACSSGAMEPSHVLIAMGYSRRQASSALRLSLGRTTTAEEIDRSIPVIASAVRQVTA